MDWEEWFAWFPIVADGRLVWLRYVDRRWNWRLNNWCDMSGYSGSDGGWEYRNKTRTNEA